MFKVTKYPHGTFSWADCNSTDVATAKQFYADLMGWETEDLPMGEGTFYTMYKQDGDIVTAISPMPPGMDNVPSHWNNYITVDDVDALQGKVTELGGTVIVEPMDVFDNGRMMTIADPSGAVVSLWQPKSHIGASLINTPGAMTWNEMYTRDAEKAKAFFSELLGWDFSSSVDQEGYDFIMNKGRPNGGIFTMPPEMDGIPPYWTTYFSVADVEATVEKAQQLGGELHREIMDAQGVGRFGLLEDPTGAMFIAIQLNEPMPWDGE